MISRITRKRVRNPADTTSRLSLIKSARVTFSKVVSYMDRAPVSMEEGMVRRVLFRMDIRIESPRLTAKEVLPGWIRKTLWSRLSSLYWASAPESARKQSASPFRTAASASAAESYSRMFQSG